MKRKSILSLFAVLVVTIFLSATFINAYKGDYTQTGPNYSLERHEAMQNAFENLDYDAWYELMTENGKNSKVVNVITKDNFEKFVQAHNAGKAGDIETAKEIRAELGLNNGQGAKNGDGFKKNNLNSKGLQKNKGLNQNCPYLN